MWDPRNIFSGKDQIVPELSQQPEQGKVEEVLADIKNLIDAIKNAKNTPRAMMSAIDALNEKLTNGYQDYFTLVLDGNNLEEALLQIATQIKEAGLHTNQYVLTSLDSFFAGIFARQSNRLLSLESETAAAEIIEQAEKLTNKLIKQGFNRDKLTQISNLRLDEPFVYPELKMHLRSGELEHILQIWMSSYMGRVEIDNQFMITNYVPHHIIKDPSEYILGLNLFNLIKKRIYIEINDGNHLQKASYSIYEFMDDILTEEDTLQIWQWIEHIEAGKNLEIYEGIDVQYSESLKYIRENLARIESIQELQVFLARLSETLNAKYEVELERKELMPFIVSLINPELSHALLINIVSAMSSET